MKTPQTGKVQAQSPIPTYKLEIRGLSSFLNSKSNIAEDIKAAQNGNTINHNSGEQQYHHGIGKTSAEIGWQ